MKKNISESKLVGLIGYPIKHSLSPLIFNSIFKEKNMNWKYTLLSPKNEKELQIELKKIRDSKWRGFNVTMPYKESIVKFLDELDLSTKVIGAVNLVSLQRKHFKGYNTDGIGLVNFLKNRENIQLEKKRILVIGAGGAAKSSIVSLISENVKEVLIVNRTIKKARFIKESLKKYNKTVIISIGNVKDIAGEVGNYDLVINATPCGMGNLENVYPIPENAMESLSKRQIVLDMVYEPEETVFLKKAKVKGAKVFNGVGMLIYQAAHSFKLWTNEEAPIEFMFKVIDAK
ncbi:MAG: shikimate dehydrogenase [Actinomycetia bacterium]|nr:shikimate dehydrogenase [Actinomycetes bacterium]